MNNKEFSEKVKKELTIEQIFQLVESLGGSPSMINERTFSAMTICHSGHSHKLYYYDNSEDGGIFNCYTNCGSFDIFELIIKLKKEQENIEYSMPQAVNFIIKFFNLAFSQEIFGNDNNQLQDWKVFKNYEKNSSENNREKIVEFKFYDDNILNNLPQPRILPWEREGITREVIQARGIRYDPVYQGIVIPHYDIDGHLIGIRERTLIKEEEENGKYKPAILNYKMYNHALGFNLFNLNNSKENIKKIKKVIVFEGEKSPLLYSSYFGLENDITVAVCGSNLIQYQVDLLLGLGVEEIIIAFDKQYKELGDEEWKAWVKKLENIYNKFGKQVLITFMFDKWNLLGYKMSPIDNGKDVFLELFERRIKV